MKVNTRLNRSVQGVSFCGYRVTRDYLRLSRRRQRRYKQLRQAWEQAYSAGRIDALTLQRAYDAVHAITLPADSQHWRRQHLRRSPVLDV